MTEEQMEGATPFRMWFVSWNQGFGADVEGLPAVGSDWMATAYRLRDGRVYIEYRFRYYRQGGFDAFDMRDLKNWQSMVSEGAGSAEEAKAIEICRQLFNFCQIRATPTVADEVVIHNGDLPAALKGRSWAHFRTAVNVD